MKKEVEHIISGLVARLKEKYQPEKIILYGSYAYGTPDKASDIDLLIIKDTKDRPIDRRVTVARIVSDSKRLIPIESIVLTPAEVNERLKIEDQFIEEILKKGKVLYAA